MACQRRGVQGKRAVFLWVRQAGWPRPNVTRKPVAEMIASLQAAPHLSLSSCANHLAATWVRAARAIPWAESAWPHCQLHPSHELCAGLHDLASVSTTVRPFSNSLRRAPAPVSTNVRQKLPLIARRGVHHCAPLHLGQAAPQRLRRPRLAPRAAARRQASGRKAYKDECSPHSVEQKARASATWLRHSYRPGKRALSSCLSNHAVSAGLWRRVRPG